ncbi:MAG: hypothetical protein LBU51_10895 [Bacteroidales bacterium]|jgi:hypothetical protein|nr:hypothetical protein [Bacteroidales bacterium]
MKRIYTFFALLSIIITFFFAGCHSKNKNVQENMLPEPVEYPIAIIPDELKTDLADNGTLYPITNDFLRDFIHRALDFNGQHISVHIDLPQEWGVVCVEYRPEGRELWLVQSQNREWMYLVMTSGMGTQRILDILPVAVNLSVQDQDILETEIWTTHRDADGSFMVQKEYEWIKSIAPTRDSLVNISDFQRSKSIVEVYIINEMDRFELTTQLSGIDYQAVIFYYDQNLKPEEWDENVMMLESYCEEKGVIFQEIYGGYKNVKITDYMLNVLDSVDISPYTNGRIAGMVMLKSGEKPKNIDFGSYERMISEIRRYFKLLDRR